MALELSVDSLDSVEEKFRPLYVEDNGKFILPVNLPKPEDNSGLKSALCES